MTNLAGGVQTTYDIIFTATTNAQIKTIEMDFSPQAGQNFNIASATRLIERDGIGSGSLSVTGQTLKYTVKNAVDVPAGTVIRLEIARIVASSPCPNCVVSITTKNPSGGVIDGPTLSSSFPIRGIDSNGIEDGSITGSDISPNFMIRKTLKDDVAGHSHGWDPNGFRNVFFITDSDMSGPHENLFVDILVDHGAISSCTAVAIFADDTFGHGFAVTCSQEQSDGSSLEYIITKLPSHVVTEIITFSSANSPFDSLQVDK